MSTDGIRPVLGLGLALAALVFAGSYATGGPIHAVYITIQTLGVASLIFYGTLAVRLLGEIRDRLGP